MAEKKFNNEGKVSIWEKTSKAGKQYYSGTAYVGNVAYNVTLFENERTSEAQPMFTGTIELREAK